MRRRWILNLCLVVFVAISTVSCAIPTPSVYSLAEDDEIVFDPELLGHWAELEEDEDSISISLFYTFTRSTAGDGYEVETMSEDCESFSFKAAVADLEEVRFLILTADEEELLFAIPTYAFLRFDLSPGVINVSMIDPDWLSEQLESNPELLSHLVRTDGDDDAEIVLTAPTPDLRAFYVAHLDTPDAYEQAGHYVRLSDADAAALRASWCTEEADPAADPDVGGAIQ